MYKILAVEDEIVGKFRLMAKGDYIKLNCFKSNENDYVLKTEADSTKIIIDNFNTIENICKKNEFKYCINDIKESESKVFDNADKINKISKSEGNELMQKIIIEMCRKVGLLDQIDQLDKAQSLINQKEIFELKEFTIEDRLENIHVYYLEIIVIIFQFIIKNRVTGISDIFYKDMNFYEEIKKLETKKEIESLKWETLLNTIEYLIKLKQEENSAIKEAKKFINENYSKKITLDVVSKKVGFSKTYFSKIFAEETGVNFIVYLNDIRIENAKKLLSTTEMKIYEVSYLVGYSNIEHFSRTFKKLVGISPLQYKNRQL